MNKEVFTLNCTLKGEEHPNKKWLEGKAISLRNQLSTVIDPTMARFSVRVKRTRIVVIVRHNEDENLANMIDLQLSRIFERNRFNRVNSKHFSIG